MTLAMPYIVQTADTAKIVNREFDQLKVRLFGRDQTVKGRIVLTLLGILLNDLIMPMLIEFQENWPEIITCFEKLDLNTQRLMSLFALRVVLNNS
ncbi:MAG: hypothetical protein ACI89U_001589 [Gammaproteobacteria bacterium]|jgi:hypothetical protein